MGHGTSSTFNIVRYVCGFSSSIFHFPTYETEAASGSVNCMYLTTFSLFYTNRSEPNCVGIPLRMTFDQQMTL